GTRFERSFEMKESTYVDKSTGKNLFNTEDVVADKYMASTGTHDITSNSGFGMSGMIPVTEGESYTLSGTRGRAGLAFFENDTDITPIDGSWDVRAVLPITVVAPAGANFVAFNLYSTSFPTYSNIQFEVGSAATAYEPFELIKKIKPEFIDIPFDEEITEDGENSVKGKTIYPLKKDLESVLQTSPNLFNVADVQDGKRISTGAGFPITNTAGWGMSAMIPVDEG